MGSRSHYVAIGQGKEDVKEFGVYNEDLAALIQHLLDKDITHVCMESTGTYWQSLFGTIQEAGITAELCNGRYTKNPSGKKTDVQDCQHLQKLYWPGHVKSQFFTRCNDRTIKNLQSPPVKFNRTRCRQRT